MIIFFCINFLREKNEAAVGEKNVCNIEVLLHM